MTTAALNPDGGFDIVEFFRFAVFGGRSRHRDGRLVLPAVLFRTQRSGRILGLGTKHTLPFLSEGGTTSPVDPLITAMSVATVSALHVEDFAGTAATQQSSDQFHGHCPVAAEPMIPLKTVGQRVGVGDRTFPHARLRARIAAVGRPPLRHGGQVKA
jgi:hypothetical protein